LKPKPFSIELNQEPFLWKSWKYEHAEFIREYETKINYGGDKILILGGNVPDEAQRTPNLILVDPENQTFKVIPSIGDDVESCSWGDMSACYWKDSKIVVFGGYDYSEDVCHPTVAVVTLKDLDSESIFFVMKELYFSLLIDPSAHWEKMVTPTELFRLGHSAHIYQDKMYVFGGNDENGKKYDIWSLDLGINVVFVEDAYQFF